MVSNRFTHILVRASAPIFIALLALSPVSAAPRGSSPASSASGTWKHAGYMTNARWDHTATLLPNGQVLVAGGACGSTQCLTTSSADLLDPGARTWTATGSMTSARFKHTATLLPSGQVLVAGGSTDCCTRLSSAELYDPTTGTWTATGSMITGRFEHTATLLPSGQVLVAGGCASDGCPTASAEVYDPTTGTWTATGSMTAARYRHTATLLQDGRVLVAGGCPSNPGCTGLSSAELYDPTTGTWSTTGSLTTARGLPTATLLPGGRVLVAGGCSSSTPGPSQPSCPALSSAELYDPATGTWTATASMSTARYRHTATLLKDGRVLVAGGLSGCCTYLSSAELYDPATGTWSTTGSMILPRAEHTATLLATGQVLVAGGCLRPVLDLSIKCLSSAEIYFP